MKTHEHYIAEETLAVFPGLIGETIASIMPGSYSEIRLDKNLVHVQSCVIEIGSKFLLIESDWQEDTEVYGLAGHMFNARFVTREEILKIASFAVNSGETVNQVRSRSTIAFNQRKITKIEIFCRKQTEGDEQVEFDAALMIHSVGEPPIVMAAVESIAGGFEISMSADAYDGLKAAHTLRVSV